MIRAFLKPWIKKINIQPTWNNKPFGKPLKCYAIKLGFTFYMLMPSNKLKFHLSKIGKIEYPPT